MVHYVLQYVKQINTFAVLTSIVMVDTFAIMTYYNLYVNYIDIQFWLRYSPPIPAHAGEVTKLGNLQEEKNQQIRTKVFHIIINTRPKDVTKEVLTFDDIIKLAFPTPDGINNPIFTVAFKNADQEPSSGTLVSGESVKIKNGTNFSVTRTGQS